MEASTWKAVLFCLPVHMDCSARCGDERMVASPVVLARTVKAIDHRSCKQVAVTPIEIRIRFQQTHRRKTLQQAVVYVDCIRESP